MGRALLSLAVLLIAVGLLALGIARWPSGPVLAKAGPAKHVCEPVLDKLPEEPKRVLYSALAGSWYDGDRHRLSVELQGFLDEVKSEPIPDIRALILPHAGYAWSGRVAAHGVKQVAGRKFSRVVVIGLNHGGGLVNVASLPDATHYGTPLGETPVDRAFVRALLRHPLFQTIPAVHQREHSVQIQIPLLQKALGEFRLVPILLGRLDLETSRRMARILLGLIDRHTLVIASSDFTHYGSRFKYVPFRRGVETKIEQLDMDALEAIRTLDDEAFSKYLRRTRNTVCGRCAIGVLLGMLGPETGVHLMKYDRSGRMQGDHSTSVSYFSIAFEVEWPDADRVPAKPLTGEERERLLELAEKTLRYRFEKDSMPTAEELGIEITEAMRRPRGVFVTLKKEGKLRGCIGQIYALSPLHEAVMKQVVNSALNDNRFPRVTIEELPDLEISISALTDPEPVDSKDAIVLARHGIILDKGGRRSIFLAQVAAEQGWGLEETLSNLSRKAGLPDDAWKEGATFSVFEAEVFGEAAE
jgi:AmmeMemoRadiSam system protein B/AmmeMemoRadiSam system protein A